MKKIPFFLIIFIVVCLLGLIAIIGCDGDGDDSDGTDGTPGILYSEKEMTSDGGSISIIDEYNNTIHVTFPEEALTEPVRISLGVLSEQPSFPIETQYVSSFEMKPHDTVLYKPIKIMVTYASAVKDIDLTMLFRKKSDTLLMPLANHENLGPQTTRADAFMMGLFAEGIMTPDQIFNQIDLLSASNENQPNQRNLNTNEESIDSTCYTEIIKAVWEEHKEQAFALEEFFNILENYVEKQLIGADEVDVEEWDSICIKYASAGGQWVLDNCTPEDICDHNYVYTITSALDTIQVLGCIHNNEVYTQLNERYDAIIDDCTKDGYLDIHLSALEIQTLYDPTGTGGDPILYSEIQYDESGRVPLLIEVVNTSGFEDVRTTRSRTFDLNGGGHVVHWPGRPTERKCQITMSGYILVDVSGQKDYSDTYTLWVTTRHYTERTEICPSVPPVFSPLDHTKSRTFEVVLDPENNYADTAQAQGDMAWNISAELFPKP